jgi:hypothetical protein
MGRETLEGEGVVREFFPAFSFFRIEDVRICINPNENNPVKRELRKERWLRRKGLEKSRESLEEAGRGAQKVGRT